MDNRIIFQDAEQLLTPMLAVFAVDLAIGKDAEAIPVLLNTSDAVTKATEKFIRSGEFKDAKGRRISVANEKIPAFCYVISDITPTLKRVLKTTDGNLSVHARKLEDAQYVSCVKFFEGRVPRTEYRLTASGRRALAEYLDQMEEWIRVTREDH